NQAILIFALSALLQFPRIMIGIFRWEHSMLWGMLPLIGAALMIQQNLAAFDQREKRGDFWLFQQKWIHVVVVLPIMLSSVGVTVVLSQHHEMLGAIFGAFLGLLCLLSFFGCYRDGFPAGWKGLIIFVASVLGYNAVAAGAGIALIYVTRAALHAL